jgi:4-hydroxy-tetrahydrodipicolinate reductase
MGLEITRAAHAIGSVRIVGAVEREGSPAVGQDLGDIAGLGPIGVVVDTRFESAIALADVVIDLSSPQVTGAVVGAARAAKKPLVCGTTGLGDDGVALFDAAATEIPVLYASNLSLGVAVMTALVQQAARALGQNYDVEIVEMHHRDKVDAPSGTALSLARAAAESLGLGQPEPFCFGREGHTGKRPNSHIGIHAVRGGGVFGEHTVIFADRHERVEITHRASSRALFAQGAIKAARFLAARPPGRYTMTDVLGIG